MADEKEIVAGGQTPVEEKAVEQTQETAEVSIPEIGIEGLDDIDTQSDEIGTLKQEMAEIKELLGKLVDKPAAKEEDILLPEPAEDYFPEQKSYAKAINATLREVKALKGLLSEQVQNTEEENAAREWTTAKNEFYTEHPELRKNPALEKKFLALANRAGADKKLVYKALWALFTQRTPAPKPQPFAQPPKTSGAATVPVTTTGTMPIEQAKREAIRMALEQIKRE